jgi:hypothetical protein
MIHLLAGRDQRIRTEVETTTEWGVLDLCCLSLRTPGWRGRVAATRRRDGD